MKRLRCILAVILAAALTFVPTAVFADDGAAENDEKNRIVTEYYSPDLTDPPTIDATETVAHAGMAEPEVPAKSAKQPSKQRDAPPRKSTTYGSRHPDSTAIGEARRADV